MQKIIKHYRNFLPFAAGILIFIFLLSGLFSPKIKNALPTPDQTQTFSKAHVEKILKEQTVGENKIIQDIRVRFLDGSQKGKEATIFFGKTSQVTLSQKVHVGETLVINSSKDAKQNTIYSVYETFRLPVVLGIIAGFFVFIVLLTRKKGFGAILGMLISLTIIARFIVPYILNGADPLFVSIVGSFCIMLITIFLAHGFSKQTTIAVIATTFSLILTGVFALIFVKLGRLSGLGSEEIYALQYRFHDLINFQGLLLGGIIIGTLGVLDDVTTTQSATIFALAEANPKYDALTLIKRGFAIGTEHIVSLVNTLVLAYAGAAIGVFILAILILQSHMQPWWVLLNSEFLVEEIVRTLAGSIGLILAVPITTVLAAFFARNEIKIS